MYSKLTYQNWEVFPFSLFQLAAISIVLTIVNKTVYDVSFANLLFNHEVVLDFVTASW